jgi:NitT/TauT family transport system permease protein
MTRSTKRAIVIVLQVATVVLLLLLWQGISTSAAVNFSRPNEVGKALIAYLSRGPLIDAILATLREAAIGLLLGVMLAIVLAALLTANRTVGQILDPFVSVVNAIPRVALAPLFLLVFGIGDAEKFYFVVAVVFFIPFFTLYRALLTIDRNYLDNMKAMGASRLSLVWEVYVPAVIGSTVASLRVASAFALISAVIAELVTTSSAGLGLQLLQAESNQQPDFMIATILLISVIAFLFDRIFWLIEKPFSAWRLA